MFDGRDCLACMYLEQFALIVDDYDSAIRFFELPTLTELGLRFT